MFSRTAMMIGDEGIKKLKNAKVAVFGVGGVGGYAVEALIRSGVGEIDIFDNDTVSESNLNRQIIATIDTIGKYKVDVMKERAERINPSVKVNAHKCFYMPDNADMYDFSAYSYIIDAIDTVTGKLEIIMRASKAGIPMISCMGAGNKMEASMFEVCDIYKTSMCPLARTMRRELKKRDIKSLNVVYSKEKPYVSEAAGRLPGSMAFSPAVAGMIAAGEAVKYIVFSA